MINHLETMWKALKEIGKFQGFSSYEEWLGREGNFKDTLTEKEKKDYDYMFNEDSPEKVDF